MELDGGGFILIRASNTSAKISFKTEMNTAKELLVINQELDELLKTYQEGETPQITGDDWKNEIQIIFQTIIREKNIELMKSLGMPELSKEKLQDNYGLLGNLIQLIEDKDDSYNQAWLSILRKYREGEKIINKKVGKKNGKPDDLTKLGLKQKEELIVELTALLADYFVPEEIFVRLNETQKLHFTRIAQAARNRSKLLIAQLEKELKSEEVANADSSVRGGNSKLYSLVSVIGGLLSHAPDYDHDPFFVGTGVLKQMAVEFPTWGWGDWIKIGIIGIMILVYANYFPLLAGKNEPLWFGKKKNIRKTMPPMGKEQSTTMYNKIGSFVRSL